MKTNNRLRPTGGRTHGLRPYNADPTPVGTRPASSATLNVRILLIIAALLLMLAAAALTRAQDDTAPVIDRLHPPIPLLDADGALVRDSGAPISTMTSCGTCHDTAFIASHSVHVDAGASLLGTQNDEARPWVTGVGWYGGWNPVSYVIPSQMPLDEWLRDYGWRHVGGGPASETGMEMDCFACHSRSADTASRTAALQAGDFVWASTATLANTGIVNAEDGAWAYNPDAFDANGAVSADALALGAPTNANCAACHGVAHAGGAQPLSFDPTDSTQWHTQMTGAVFSPERISASGQNLAGKNALTRAWDVHAERVVGCVDCHYALNNPVFYVEPEAGRPSHLQFDPRRMTFEDFLSRPLHQFANGGSDYADAFPVFEQAGRSCADCHDAEATHEWLPYAGQHLEAMTCETCHIPELQAPALAAIDWTTLDADGEPHREWRGLDASSSPALLTGYAPVILPDEGGQLAPYNLVSAWYWVAGEPAAPVALDDLRAAFFDGDTYDAQVMAVFDADGDGQLSETERRIDSDGKTNLIAAHLMALGYESPRIAADVEAHAVNHGVTNGEWALRECSSCHQNDSRLAAPILLASHTPGGVLPHFTGGADGALAADDGGRVQFTPVQAVEPVGLYIFGRDAVAWIDWLGVGLLLAVMGGVVVHGGLRVFFLRRMGDQAHHADVTLREEYLYSVYERQWHWLQTAVIFGLLFTGLIIHKPELFPLFQFRWLVLVHNALAGILIVNAALAAFYHLASGEIRQFIPEPRGFFGQMFAQARFYAYGIFRGEPHPIEKSRQRKMNPIQQVTYLALLNVLLPVQVITGVLMWMAGDYPGVVAAVGGLPVIAPVHALCSWLMASFIVLHVYMTTTGHTPLANIKAMMFGWDEIETTAPQGTGDD